MDRGHFSRPPTTMKLNVDQRRALEFLAAACSRGIPEDLMINAHMFERNLLVGLIRGRLAVATTEKVMAGQRAVSVARLRITDAGQLALVKGA
jgi:hypothetical protein